MICKESKSTMSETGDCSVCEYDPENNRNCPGYIAIQIFEVKEAEGENENEF